MSDTSNVCTVSDDVVIEMEETVQTVVEETTQVFEETAQTVVEETTQVFEEMERKVSVFADSYEDDIKLDLIQEYIISLIHQEAKAAAEPILNDDSLPVSVKITKLLGAIMALLEKARLNGAKIANENKRVIALYLLKRLLKEVLEDSAMRSELLHEATQVGHYLLEALVSVSKGMAAVLKSVEEKAEDSVSTECCGNVLSVCAAMFK